MRPAVDDSVHVWYCLTERLSAGEMAEARGLLSSDERARYDRFHFPRDARDYAAAHAMVRSALSFHEGLPPSSWIFDADGQGKPVVASGQPSVEFNLAHTRGLAACALSRAAIVGIDVESCESAVDVDRMATRYFSGPEIAALRRESGSEQRARFTELWTLKEAFLKAVGTGLTSPLGDFGFEWQGASRIQFNAPSATAPGDWQFALFAPSPHHRMAVAVRSRRNPSFVIRAWPPTRESALPLLRSSSPDVDHPR